MSTRRTNTLEVHTALSGTPLARRHERTVGGKLTRIPKSLPWSAFRRSGHPRAALALATDLWLGLARGEYGAVGLFSKIATAMTAAGAPFDLVYAATVASGDEARHAEYCLRMAALSRGEDASLAIDPAEFGQHLAPIASEEELDVTLVNAVAVSETLATALLTACQRRASDRLSRSLLTAILSDEVHHARLGWYYLAHRAPRWTTAERQRLADAAADVVVGVEEEFWVGRDAPASASGAARALGVLDSKSQRAVIRDVMENEIVPGLDALGFGASRVWPLRRRGGKRARR
ncbi:MAG TPA: ferritin-like domain-containing protein [Polyangiaceae bacterium]|nr:ferritin-like domain-containing protein [Polyangiaceae bacterium]